MKVYDYRNTRDLRTMLTRRHTALLTERSSWDSHWADIARVLMPRHYRAMATDRNRTSRARYNRIYDNTGTRALRVLEAGMMTGATSPARRWFRLITRDPDLNEFYSARSWLDACVERMEQVFRRSNTYRVLHQAYGELGGFGTAVAVMRPHFENVIHLYPVVCGEYALQQDYQGEVCALYREFERSVGEVVTEFGYENCSVHVQNKWDQHELEAAVRLLHVIEKREDQSRKPGSLLPRDMPYRSVYLELHGENDSQVLRDSGFETFPVLAPRWAVAGGDVYGVSPGMEALGDIRQLQQQQLRKGQAIDYQTRPPLQVPSSLRDRETEMFPGGVSYYEPGMMAPFDQVNPNGGIRPMFEVNLQLDHLLNDMLDCRERIRGAFYADLFLMLSLAGPNTRMTATEVAERHEEKLLMLGPVLERLHNELLQPLIDFTFTEMFNRGMLPPPPPELQGMELGVEFVSILAQAQKAIGTASVDRLVGNTLQIAQVQQATTGEAPIMDKFNWDHWVDHYGSEMLGVDTELMVPDEKVRAIRAARAKMQAAQAAIAAQREQAATAKDLAQSPTDGQNALTDFLSSGTEPGVPM